MDCKADLGQAALIDLVPLLSPAGTAPGFLPRRGLLLPALNNSHGASGLCGFAPSPPRWLDRCSRRRAPSTAHSAWQHADMAGPWICCVLRTGGLHWLPQVDVAHPYRRADALEKRRALMEAWAAFFEHNLESKVLSMRAIR